MLCASYFTVFFCTCIVVIHVAPFTLDLGQSASTGALMLAVIGGASIAGRFMLGSMGDRTGSRRALLVCFIIFILVFVWLQFTQQLWQLFLFAVFYGFAHGGFYALISPVVAEAFGLRSHGLIFGCIVFVASVGGALGPVVAGYIFDVSESYNLAFLLLLASAGLGFAAMLGSGLSSRKGI
jgi:MFS family permease